MNQRLQTTAGGISRNVTVTMEILSLCFHDDDEFKYRAYTVTYLLVFPVAFLCNVAALVVFFRQRRRRTSASCVVMMNLALSDGSFSLTLPLRLNYYFRDAAWDLPDWLCRLCVYGFYVNLYTSILFLTLLSVLRWLAVCRPYRHRTLATTTRVLLVCVGIWVFVGVSSMPFLSHGVTMRGDRPRCFEPSNFSSWERVRILNYVAVVLGFLVPFLTIIICYSKLIHRLTATADPEVKAQAEARQGRGARWGRQNRLDQQNRPDQQNRGDRPDRGDQQSRPDPPDRPDSRRQSRSVARESRLNNKRRSVHMVTMVTATFLLCFLPYHVIRSLHLHAVCSGWSCGTIVALQRAVVVTLCLAASNSVVDPLLYYYSTRSFRENMQNSLLSSRRGSFRPDLALVKRRSLH